MAAIREPRWVAPAIDHDGHWQLGARLLSSGSSAEDKIVHCGTMKRWVQLVALAIVCVFVALAVVLGARHFDRRVSGPASRLRPVSAARLKADAAAAAAAAVAAAAAAAAATAAAVTEANHSYASAFWRCDACSSVRLAPSATPSKPWTFLLTLVPSRVDNERGRQAIRLTYGSLQSERNRTVRTVFVVGRPEPAAPAIDDALRRESEQHGDIVQFDFADTYNNLTLKTVLALRWAVTAYDGGRIPGYVLKADEDVLVNYERVVDLVLTLRPAELKSLYTGYVWHAAAPIRDPRNKYYVSKQQYAGDTYPDYVAGPSYLLSAEAVGGVVAAAPSLPFLDMEDVFVGLCAQRANLRATLNLNFGNFLVTAYDYCEFSSMITVHGVSPEWKERYWSDRAARISSGSRCDGRVHRRSIRSVRGVSRGSSGGIGWYRYAARR